MILRHLAAGASALALLASPALAQSTFPTPNPAYPVQGTVSLCANSNTPPQYVPCPSSSSGTAQTANQGAAGTSPWPAVVAQYNATLPTVASGSTTYVQTDANGRLIIAPSSNVAVSNFPASQAVTSPDAVASGTIAAATSGASYTVASTTYGTARFVVTGLTASGATLTAQYSANNGASYSAIAAVQPPNVYSTTLTADGSYEVKANATTNLRLTVTTTGTGTINVASDLTNRQGLVALVASPAIIGKVGIDQTTPGTTNLVQVGGSLPTGTNTIGAVNQGTSPWVVSNGGTFAAQAGQYNATPPTYATGASTPLATDTNGRLIQSPGATVAPVASTAGGVSPLSRLVSSAATTNATGGGSLAGAHRVFRIFGCNTTTAAVYLKLYNTATAPTPGTTAVFDSRPLPAAASAGSLACQSFDIADIGLQFTAGLGYALTTGNADTDATAPAAGAVVQLVFEGL